MANRVDWKDVTQMVERELRYIWESDGLVIEKPVPRTAR